ncbi:D-TA family PLP-dependent enzyme [Defluviimonas sp. WL0075]|uniref:D-TA family PLP-dependent enzyme n=1 Tax=Albidovulum sediminicola TaxID=2984331 RepID=A0ABT2Z1W2_9RHOB|nr:D-TA family PLP-dependent enzyme [Defluviimonas sp. WL0075]MCV2865129.1 D-TA family PLP-dependent enzyme [Defluviimonas sp. WL0075]
MIFPTIDTPSVLVDLDIAEANIDRFQSYCDAHGLGLRPHIKTHKLPMLARRQIAAGAIGITCQKVSEAEAMIADGGIDDVLITYNILGADKTDRLRRLAERVALTVVADSATVAKGLAGAFQGAARPLGVLVECDTGAGRCGVQTPAAARDLALEIARLGGLRFAGLMTYPPIGREAAVQSWLQEAKTLIEAAGLAVTTISNGGTPGMWQAHEVPAATEYRAGTYIYNDRSLQARGLCGWDDCALTVLATVVSVPTETRAIIDAGSKVLTSDLLGLQGYGHVLGRPDIRIDALSEEHGTLHAERIGLSVGERVRIVPNHACVVTNMLDRIELVRGARHEVTAPVMARGRVW